MEAAAYKESEAPTESPRPQARPESGTVRPRARPGTVGVGSFSDKEILALTLQAEAGGEGYEGMLAAGSVIANRAASGKYGEGISGVIMKPGQFSAWNSVTGYAGGEGGLDMDKIRPSESALKAAEAILSGNYEDITGGATHYYNPSVATPKWGGEVGDNWFDIGSHRFGKA
jgi:spore germination cell wall hydrolase CwlJ-like protein